MMWASIETLLQALGRGLYHTPLTVSVRHVADQACADAEHQQTGLRAVLAEAVSGLRSQERLVERIPAKWMPVRVKKTRQNKELEPPFRFNRNGKGSSERVVSDSRSDRSGRLSSSRFGSRERA